MKVILPNPYFSSVPSLMNVDLSECIGWEPWRSALGITSAGGGFVVEYIFFILFSVSALLYPSLVAVADVLVWNRSSLRSVHVS
jgi:hypothetical protein